jgi:hypothetical protein
MVCDLQGIFNADMIPPTFELTDPAIHYASAKGRWMVFGRTDKGRSGTKAFFKTHHSIATKLVKCFTSLPATKSGVVTGIEKALIALISGSIN